MAEIRDRNQPHQVHVRPQYRYDNPAGVGYGGGGKNYHSGGPSATQILAVLTLLPVGGSLLALSGNFHGGDGVLVVRGIRVDGVVVFELCIESAEVRDGDGADGLGGGTEEDAGAGADMAGYVGAKTKEVGQKIESKANEAQVTTASART
ncbi:hypothetical protein F3Y22_tig00109916pilonHSYRG00054 [Hibiscus syriacus]|uniref:Uncharacterized protein n=1 Tax=Hibiscus syriacus TaxID=106335 RepID=A0A6A3BVZ9_HIBSY|nr:hypothetical protein F3Y22_tig00109916pilonHSYRG00054 [Hibiscus syriacus]